MLPVGDVWNHIAITAYPETKFIKAQGQGKTGGATITTGTTIHLKAGEQITACLWGEFACYVIDVEAQYDPSALGLCRFAGFLVTPTDLD